MSRWNFKIDDNWNLVAEPDYTVLGEFVVRAAVELQEKIMEHEEKLVLTTISEAGLRRLIDLCEIELRRRRKIK